MRCPGYEVHAFGKGDHVIEELEKDARTSGQAGCRLSTKLTNFPSRAAVWPTKAS
jgi:hypothetical protein